MSESEFQLEVVETLETSGFVVETDVYLPRTERVADLVATAGPVKIAGEVENDFESVFGGIGQSLLYGSELRAIPVVFLPYDAAEFPETESLRHSPVSIVLL